MTMAPPFKSAEYYPLQRGIYEVAPGLFPWGTDFGNGRLDQSIFQFDQNFQNFRKNKIEALGEDSGKYICRFQLNSETESRVARFITERLVEEWPEYFQKQGQKLGCLLTGDLISPTLDDLLRQVPEDMSILSRKDLKNWLSYLNVCSPSHWAPGDKIGLDFNSVHTPVAGFEKMARAADNLVDAMIHRGPFVRFVWSFVTDQQLNHHPVAPSGVDPFLWKGRSFDSSKSSPFYLRIERQVTWGLPDVEASMFFIRISFLDGLMIKNDEVRRKLLISSLRSMTPESRKYKGIDHCYTELMNWLGN